LAFISLSLGFPHPIFHPPCQLAIKNILKTFCLHKPECSLYAVIWISPVGHGSNLESGFNISNGSANCLRKSIAKLYVISPSQNTDHKDQGRFMGKSVLWKYEIGNAFHVYCIRTFVLFFNLISLPLC